VEVNGLPQGHATDQALCAGPKDFLVTGSGTVTVNSKPAARVTDKSMHGGSVLVGSVNVLIGGPTVGATLGNPDAAKKACEAAAKGRSSNSTQQSYGNCGIETTRQILNQATGQNVSEDDLLKEAIQKKLAADSSKPDERGGSYPEDNAKLLNQHGVPAQNVDGTMDNLTQGVAEGKGVGASVWAGSIWPPSSGYKPGTGAHPRDGRGVRR
jgi:hypothetical protein